MRFVVFLILFANLAGAAPAGSVPRNYFELSGKVSRSGAPTSQVANLVARGFTEVLIIKTETGNQVSREIAMWKAAGFSDSQIHHIPMDWTERQSANGYCHALVKALKVLVRIEASENRSRILFHCTAGEDRTGALAGLYQMLMRGWSLEKSFSEELCARGYEAGDDNKPEAVVLTIRKGLTPAFVRLGTLIQRGVLTRNNISEDVCESSALRQIDRALVNEKPFVCR